MGAAFVMQMARGIDPWRSGLGPVIALNLVLSFVIPGISIGAHLGGLATGAVVGLALEHVRPCGARRRWRSPAAW
jgi:membrane associated rhomboid family serine protease